MKIKEFFNKKINVAWVTAILIMIAILTIYVATSYSKFVLEKELTFNLEIIESEEWNKRTLITGEELGTILLSTGATQAVFGFKGDFLAEIENIEGTGVALVDESKSFKEDDIKLYTVTENEDIITAYILSEYQIKANTNSSKMFYNNENLTDIFFLNFETSIVENMDSMFYGCKNITELNLHKFDTNNVTNIANMFYDCNLLEKIYVSELWELSKITTPQEYVFFNCVSLVGENDTQYNENNISSTYARIDTETEEGYFTYKSIETIQQFVYTFRNNSTVNTNTINTNNTVNNNEINKNDEKDETEFQNQVKSESQSDANKETNTTIDNTIESNGNTVPENNTTNNSNNDKEELETNNNDNSNLIENGEDEKKIENKKSEEDIKQTTEDLENKEIENTVI